MAERAAAAACRPGAAAYHHCQCGLLPDDSDLLRERDAAHRARVHDDRGRHPRPRITDSGATTTFFLTGVDEHATKVYRVADRRRASIRRRTSIVSPASGEHYRDVWVLSPTFSSAPPMKVTSRFVRDFLQRIYDNGDVYEDIYAGLYCVGCEAFKSGGGTRGRQMPGARRSRRIHRGEELLLPVLGLRGSAAFALRRATRLRAAAFRYERSSKLHRPGAPRLLDQPRREPWGIPLPWDEGQVAYVWADALVNYLSALTYARPGRISSEFWPHAASRQAKDILRFHCVFWPAMLISAEYDVPSRSSSTATC